MINGPPQLSAIAAIHMDGFPGKCARLARSPTFNNIESHGVARTFTVPHIRVVLVNHGDRLRSAELDGSDKQRGALEQLSAELARLGITVRGVRDLPQGPGLMVLVNLIITHDGLTYCWREGRTERTHPGDDPQGAAAAIAALADRLQGPAFQPASQPHESEASG
jgi:hypothetical protein